VPNPWEPFRSSSALSTIGCIAYRQEEGDGSAQREQSVIYDCLVFGLCYFHCAIRLTSPYWWFIVVLCSCSVCSKNLGCWTSFRDHFNSQHRIDMQRCTQCAEPVPSGVLMVQHMTQKHLVRCSVVLRRTSIDWRLLSCCDVCSRRHVSITTHMFQDCYECTRWSVVYERCLFISLVFVVPCIHRHAAFMSLTDVTNVLCSLIVASGTDNLICRVCQKQFLPVVKVAFKRWRARSASL